LDEVKACEILRVHPHPNIAQYLGCTVDDGMIAGLCFVKYGTTLLERVYEGSDDFDADLCLRGIQSGVEHLHKLGLIHCDINPANILMSGDNDDPIIIDFDSCRREGEELGLKAGTRGWTNEDFKVATPEIDKYGISMIKEFLSSAKKPKDN
jgi:serine/threonine protein kinase